MATGEEWPQEGSGPHFCQDGSWDFFRTNEKISRKGVVANL